MNIKKWELRKLDKNNAVQLANEMGIPFFLAMMLDIREINTKEKATAFLNLDIIPSDPFSLSGMEKAVSRIKKAIDEFEKIAVYGDYDADGVTATAILYSYLLTNGADVIYFIPDREKDGYGMNNDAVKRICDEGVKLIITVDNGISAVEETALANSLDTDVIITDHHRPPQILPEAYAIIDPFLETQEVGYKYLSGAGVAYKLVSALEGEENEELISENYSDLAAIGTIGDVVPLIGENRKIVSDGIAQIQNTDRPGILSLLVKSGVSEKKQSAMSLAFSIIPRINAAGRMGDAKDAVKLLICDDEDEADELAEDICDTNVFRKDIENEIYNSALSILNENPAFSYDRVIVLNGKNWHHGVIGIVAARIADKFGKPCIIISESEGTAKGSGRSIDGFSLFNAIEYSKSELLRYGGHTMAAGITLETEKIDSFRKKINEYAAGCEIPQQKILIDCKLKPSALNLEMPKLLTNLEPFGTDNPYPVFALCELTLQEIIPVGAGRHLKLRFSKDGVNVSCLKFCCTPEEFLYKPGDVLDLAVTLEINNFRGTESLGITIRDMKLSSLDCDELIGEFYIYEKFKRGEKLSSDEKTELLPDRNVFAAVYRFLKANPEYKKGPLALYSELGFTKFGKVLTALDVLEEKKLITKDLCFNNITVCEIEGKTDLLNSEIMRSLS